MKHFPIAFYKSDCTNIRYFAMSSACYYVGWPVIQCNDLFSYQNIFSFSLIERPVGILDNATRTHAHTNEFNSNRKYISISLTLQTKPSTVSIYIFTLMTSRTAFFILFHVTFFSRFFLAFNAQQFSLQTQMIECCVHLIQLALAKC